METDTELFGWIVFARAGLTSSGILGAVRNIGLCLPIVKGRFRRVWGIRFE